MSQSTAIQFKKLCPSQEHQSKARIQFICLSIECTSKHRIFCHLCLSQHMEHIKYCVCIEEFLKEQQNPIKKAQEFINYKSDILLKTLNQWQQLQFSLIASKLNIQKRIIFSVIKEQVQKSPLLKEIDKQQKSFIPFQKNMHQLLENSQYLSKSLEGNSLNSLIKSLPKLQVANTNIKKLYFLDKQAFQQMLKQILGLIQIEIVNWFSSYQFSITKYDCEDQWIYQTNTVKLYPPIILSCYFLPFQHRANQMNTYQGIFGVSLDKVPFQRDQGGWYDKSSNYSVSVKNGYFLTKNEYRQFMFLQGEPGEQYREIQCMVDKYGNLYFNQASQVKQWMKATSKPELKQGFYVLLGMIYQGKLRVRY